MKKRIIALALSTLMLGTALAGCGTSNDPSSSTPAAAGSSSSTSEGSTSTPEVEDTGKTLKVMLMPQGEIDENIKKEITEKASAITKEKLGCSVEFIMSGPAWNFDDQATIMQTGTSDIDIMPAHSWSGITYVVGAQTGQWVRLDNPDGPDGDLLAQYGQDIYSQASDALIASATVPGMEGRGIYGALIEKDSVQQLGYLMNNDILKKYNFTTDDFKPEDFANWGEKLAVIKEGEGENFYPLNVEAEVLDRIVNHVVYVDNTTGPLGISFDNSDPAATEINFVSRYGTEDYKNFVSVIRGYYEMGLVDPALGIVDTAPEAIAKARTTGNFAISSFVYAPGAEITASQEANAELLWVPAWSTPIGTTDSFMGAGLAVYAGSKNIPLAVQFLNLLNTDTELADLVAEGIEGKSYDLVDGYVTRTEDRGGWNMWRYGVVGDVSKATELFEDEWKNFKSFNDASASMECLGFLFDRTDVEDAMSASGAVIGKYAVPLGSGAADPAQLETFLAELEASGVQSCVDAANAQYAEWKTAE